MEKPIDPQTGPKTFMDLIQSAPIKSPKTLADLNIKSAQEPEPITAAFKKGTEKETPKDSSSGLSSSSTPLGWSQK